MSCGKRPSPPSRALLFLSLCLVPAPALGQATDVGGRAEIFAGSDLERYLRYLQTTGLVGAYPWSIRAFGPREVDSLVPRSPTHPWAAHFDLGSRKRTGRIEFDYVRPTASVRFNSAFPFGSNDGPVWAGKGFTEAIQAGARARWQAFSLTLAPIAFTAQNAAFPLMANGATGNLAYGDQQYPFRVDRPQRFGNSSYTVFDPGESSLRVDTRLIAAGLSTGEQYWGPADSYPFILGNNAAGFPHAFVGTGMPWNLWIGHLHGRVVYGKLSQTEYASVGTGATHRFMSGLILLLQPRPTPGLEIGASRFFHSSWPDSGGLTWSDFRIPIEGFFKRTLSTARSGDDATNQLASLYARWVLPRSGFEFYTEFGRDDHNWDLRDFILEPDHASTRMFGFRKVWMSDAKRMVALRAETIDLRLNTLTRTRGIGGGYYLNGTFPQGHTQRGQLLGADVTAGGGAATTVAVERYDASGRWTVAWTRVLVDTLGSYYVTNVQPVRTPEARHALSIETIRFRGPLDVHVSLTGVYDLNRYFTRDVFNVNAIIGARWSWR